MKPRFKVSYRGEAEFWFNGREYCVRIFANDDGHYNGNYFQSGILPFVGTVRNRREFFDFPPSEVIEAFAEEYPGIVGARYTEDFKSVEYTATPDVLQWRGDTVARFHYEQMKTWFPEDGKVQP
jgi:hypothetical protein